nr:hypothetical protein [Tanacetum cinerariifolium]
MEIDQHSLNAESDLIKSIPNHDSSVIISSKIGSLFDEFSGELTLLKSFPSGINETDCHPEKEIRLTKRLLYDNSSPHPPEKIVSDIFNADIESFSPSPIPNKDSDSHMEEIDLFLNPDDPMPLGIEEDDDDSERDISIFEEFLLPTNESYHFDIPSPYRPPAKPPDGNTGTLNIKMLGDISDQKEFKEILVTHFPDFPNTSEPSNAITNVVNAPREPYVVKQDNGSFVDEIIFDLNRAPDSPNQFHCFHCKDVLRDGEACKRCTCAKCRSGLSKGLCYICGHNQNSLNKSPRISETSSQSPTNINYCCYECGDPL